MIFFYFKCLKSPAVFFSSDSKEFAKIDLHQYHIAMISEMIHTASLVHDDVIDKSDTRRGKPTANARWGNRQVSCVYSMYFFIVICYALF